MNMESGTEYKFWRLSSFPTLVILLSLLFWPARDARTYVVLKRDPGEVTPSSLVVKYHDVNEVKLAVSNTGQIGIDLISGNGAGFWPGTSPNNYVFGTGMWIGGLGDVDGDGQTDTLLLQAYDPMSGGSEFDEGRYGQTTTDPLASVFRSNDADDLEDWPEEFKVIDQDPDSPTFGQEIPLVMSDQDIVTIYNSVDAMPLFATPSPPFEIRQRSLAFTSGLSRQVIFFIFEIENISDRVPGVEPFTLEDAWMGYDSDLDIGGEFADDRTSFFRNQVTEEGDTIPVNMGFAWDEDFDEFNFIGDPGFVGIAYIQSPGNYQDGIDNDGDGMIDESPFNGIDDDGDGVIDDEPDEVDQLGLVNYTYHNNPSTPPELRNDPESDPEGYRIMSCDPPEECVETTESTDIRFLITSGPFRIQPGEVHKIVLAFVFANAVGNPTSIDVTGDPPRPNPNDPVFGEFLAVKQTVQGVYDLSFTGGVPPPRPGMTLVPGDGQVTVLWDNIPVTTPDPNYDDYSPIDPYYREYDFEGFRLWRSRTGMYSSKGDPDDPLNPIATAENEAKEGYDLSLLGQWDLNNGITTLSNGIQVLETIVDQYGNTVVVSADTFDLGTDTGLRFSYVDRGEFHDPLLNGFKYYYSIESYDYNSPALPVSSLSSHTGISFAPENSVIPQRSTDDLEVTSDVVHVDSDGSVLDDETPDEFVFYDPPAATDALKASSVTAFGHEEVGDTHNTFVVDEIVTEFYSGTSEVRFHVEDIAGLELYTGGEALSFFTMTYDSTISRMQATVFSAADSTFPLYELSFDFLTDRESYVSPPLEALTAVDSKGNDVIDSLGTLQIPGGQFDPLGFLGTDITMTWQRAGDDTLTLSVYDTGNRLSVPVVGEDGLRAQNWEFDAFGGQPGGAYIIGQPSVFRMHVCGSVISVISPTRFPEEGDVWTLRQRSYYETAEGDTIPASRPLVPGTRYRIEFSPARDITSPEFTIGIFQNTLLTNDLDIYIVVSEALSDIPQLTVAGADVTLDEVTSGEVELYAASYLLDQSGTYSVEVSGVDTSGNEGEGSKEFSTGLILRSTGGALVSADGVIRLDVPPEAIREDLKYLLCTSDDETENGSIQASFNRSGPGGPVSHSPVADRGVGVVSSGPVSNHTYGGGDPVLSGSTGRAASPVYNISPPDQQFERGAKLSFNVRAPGLRNNELEGLGIFLRTDHGWLELPSSIDPKTYRITTTVDRLGSFQLLSGAAGVSPLPKVYRLSQNFPNPFNPSTTIGFDIPEDSGTVVWTELTVYNVRGQRVRTLLNAPKAPGSYFIQWDGRDEEGRMLASGIYLYRLKAGDFVSNRKMVLVK